MGDVCTIPQYSGCPWWRSLRAPQGTPRTELLKFTSSNLTGSAALFYTSPIIPQKRPSYCNSYVLSVGTTVRILLNILHTLVRKYYAPPRMHHSSNKTRLKCRYNHFSCQPVSRSTEVSSYKQLHAKIPYPLMGVSKLCTL